MSSRVFGAQAATTQLALIRLGKTSSSSLISTKGMALLAGGRRETRALELFGHADELFGRVAPDELRVVGGDVLLGVGDQFSIVFAANDHAAFALDDPGHGGLLVGWPAHLR
jgi:hypothetical protein